MNINLYDVVGIMSLAVIIIVIPQIIITHIISRVLHLKFTLLKRLQFMTLGIAIAIHWWALVILLLCAVLIFLICGLVLNARRTLYLIASILHIRWLAVLASDEVVYVDD